MKTVVLCRHAKSDWPEGTADINRPLSERGHQDAQTLAQTLVRQGWSPDLIISSPANRAKTTAHYIAQGVSYDPSKIHIHDSVYHEGTGSLVELVKQLPPAVENVMIFGHNPTMEQAVQFYLQMDVRFDMPTGGMLAIESDQRDWQRFLPPLTRLRWYLIPRLQRKGD